ncbi:acetylxylan esterase [Arthrobacter sp. B2a2-09]|uniref:acetylxylan esterase n=1 Tax=Arthrobacter sp. B2a2-09 TaxID=2952822 RepID=UPI0022CD8828|nr:acetylxylan esterase [Arthrobacter sp. B2a2-09]MCZ9882818.1 acetylxylan esterase [Arthrobacter sp. B2a2-09]
MALFDLPETELRRYMGSGTEPPDFDAFWHRTITEARQFDWTPQITPVDTNLTTVDVFDIRFPGFGGQSIAAWLRVPHGATEPLPTVVEFVGYGGGRGYPEESLLWASSGFAHFQMDTRGQGSVWSVGNTGDEGTTGPAHPGVMTRGILDREDYYYRRLITDAVRAVDAARTLPQVDPARVSIAGHSQGGGLALAVAGLVPDVAATAALVPFLCDFSRAIHITDQQPYSEVASFLKVHRDSVMTVMNTLANFDAVFFVRRASAPLYVSTALMDITCPPSTVYAAFNNYATLDKRIQVWPFNGHEGGGIIDWRNAVSHVRVHARLDPRVITH